MRTLIFGVDGLSFRVLHPLMDAGFLPNFQALTRDGVEAVLESKFPPYTPPGWMSLITGLKPAKHGVYDFWEYDGQGGDRLVTRRKGGKAIWNLLSEYGKKVIVVNVPLTYPPDPVNGIVVSGIQGASERGNFTYPAEFRDELLSVVPAYRVDIDTMGIVEGKLTNAQAAVQAIERRIELISYLLQEKDWDFAWITFCASDFLQHVMWEEIQALQPLVRRYYELLDEALGIARTALGADGALFVVSDHGFQGTRTKFAINEFLFRQHWLRSDRRPRRQAETVRAVGRRVLDQVGLLERARNIKHRVLQHEEPLMKQRPYFTEQEQLTAGVSVTSWSCSSAAYADLCITQTFSEQQMADLRGQLLEVTDPGTGRRLVDALYETEVYGQGPYQPITPHLLLLPSDGYTFTPQLGRPALWESSRKLFGTHHKDGVLYACGANIKRGVKGAPATIYDIVPTVLHIMNQPLHDDLDGRVLADIFVPQTQDAPPGSDNSTAVARKLRALLDG